MLIGSNPTGTFSGALSGAGFANSGTLNTSAAGGGGGSLASTITSVAGAFSSGSSSGSPWGQTLGSMGSMALAGASVGGPFGAAAGAALGLLTNIGTIFGSHGAPDHERADLNAIAAANDITADQASWVCGFEESSSPRNYDEICAEAARDKSFFLRILNKYNAAKPNEQIRTQTVVATEQAAPQYLQLQQQLGNAFAGTGKASPLANLSFPAAQAAAKQQNMSIQDYLTAIVQGALAGLQAGAAGAAADTPAGQAATWDVIKTQAKKYELVLVGLGLAVAWLITQAVQNNRRK